MCRRKGHGGNDRQWWVWCGLKLQYDQPLNTSHAQACYRHHEASWARLGSMTVSFEAVPHSPSCGVAQPQSSMKESHPAKVHLQEVDQTATASSTSNKSTSLQLLLLLHTTAGIAALRHRNECNRIARAPCASQPPMQQWHAGGRWPCHSHGRGRGSRRGERGRLHSSDVETYHRTLYAQGRPLSTTDTRP